ncbi:MAG: ATP-binding protein [Alphaproteobacteria bacterium]|nr:ATP-binding protein [Alphaproteobacteria bacterium]
MLLGLSIENWLSFKDNTEFSMIATREQQHGERLFKSTLSKNRLLPIAAIFGANASGKSNFIKIISLVKAFVINGSRPEEILPIYPYLFDDECSQKPSKFSIGMLIDNAIYEYSFTANQKQVIEERLLEVNSKSKKVLFHRTFDNISFYNNIHDKAFLDFVFKSTRKNQLFLTNSVFQNAVHFRKIYDWFYNIEIVTPEMTFHAFEQFFDEKGSLYNGINNYLKNCDVGIDKIECEEIQFGSLPIDGIFKARLAAELPEGKTFKLLFEHERFFVTKKNGNMLAKKMIAVHRNRKGKDIKFDLARESDGTLRAIDLFPAFSELCSDTSKIYVIDEIDRSLHSVLVQHLVKMYLDSCNSTKRGQLIFTTHDTNLIDQKILRRDEMWRIDKNKFGVSKFDAFSDFENIRYDQNIRKSYMDGRFGGIPHVE